MADALRSACARSADYFNCRLMPHGGRVLLPVVLATLGLASSLAHDGCDYARVSGAAAELLSGADVVPYVDCGMAAHRVPMYYPAEDAWRVAFTDDSCRPYDRMDLLADTSWAAAEWMRFLGLVAGGTTAMFLWTSACLTLRPNYWQGAGIGAALACAFQALSFVWFYTKLCHTSTRNYDDFEAGREVELGADEVSGSTCELFFGSRCSVASCVFWGAASASILLQEYPTPAPKFVALEDESKPMMIAAPAPTVGSKKDPSKRGRGGKDGSLSSSRRTNATSSASGSSQRSSLAGSSLGEFRASGSAPRSSLAGSSLGEFRTSDQSASFRGSSLRASAFGGSAASMYGGRGSAYRSSVQWDPSVMTGEAEPA